MNLSDKSLKSHVGAEPLKKKPGLFDRNLKHIEINIGTACNNKCIFCLNQGVRKFVPFEELLKEAKEYSEKKYNSVGFIGGDPTIYPKITEIGKNFTSFGYRQIHIITNGRRFSKIEFLEELIASGFNRFSISVQSHIAELEDTLTGVKGSFKQKEEGIRNLGICYNRGDFRSRPAINMIMNKMNLEDMDTTIRFYADLGVSDFRLLIIRPEGRAMKNHDRLVPTLTAVRNKLPALIALTKRHNINIFMDPPPFCLFYDIPGFNRLLGEDFIDEVVSDDEKSERSTMSWNEYRMKNKIKPAFCTDCFFYNKCEGVWKGYAEIFGTDELHPVIRERK